MHHPAGGVLDAEYAQIGCPLIESIEQARQQRSVAQAPDRLGR